MSAGPEARHTGTPEARLYITAASRAVGSGQERRRLDTAEKETGDGTAPLHYGLVTRRRRKRFVAGGAGS